MQRIHWAAETQDAHIVEGLLRVHGIDAWSFDTGIVRLDWLQTLAYGGCRVMVADADAEPARRIVEAYRKGEFAFADEEIECPCCRACLQHAGEEDVRPRRAMFLLLVLYDWIFSALFLLITIPIAMAWFLATCLVFNLALVFPGFAAWVIKSRFLCTNCGHAWRAPPRLTFEAMSRAVEGEQDESRVTASVSPVAP